MNYLGRARPAVGVPYRVNRILLISFIYVDKINNLGKLMAIILLVDDDEQLLEIGKEFLEEGSGHLIITANSAKKALSHVGRTPIDVIVSDFQMPEMDGIELLRAIKVLNDNVPFILFTGKGREEVVIEAINQGADFYIKKDTDVRSQYAQLLHTIDQALLRKEAENAVDYNLSLFKQLMENTADLVVVVDKNGIVEYVSPSIKKVLGYIEEEIIGRQGYDFINPEMKEYTNQFDIENPAPFRDRWTFFEVMRKDGTWATLEVITKLFERGGKTKTIIDARDVTEKVAKDNQLKKQLDEIGALHEIVHKGQQEKFFGGVRYDFSKKELTLSPIAKRVLGLDDYDGEIDVALIKNLIHPEDGWVLSDVTRYSTGSAEPFEVIYRVICSNGETRIINSVTNMICGENGDPLYLVGQINDLTPMMRLQEKLMMLRGNQ
jgi:PAS domain S-box-containing protein